MCVYSKEMRDNTAHWSRLIEEWRGFYSRRACIWDTLLFKSLRYLPILRKWGITRLLFNTRLYLRHASIIYGIFLPSIQKKWRITRLLFKTRLYLRHASIREFTVSTYSKEMRDNAAHWSRLIEGLKTIWWILILPSHGPPQWVAAMTMRNVKKLKINYFL